MTRSANLGRACKRILPRLLICKVCSDSGNVICAPSSRVKLFLSLREVSLEKVVQGKFTGGNGDVISRLCRAVTVVRHLGGEA